jgi:hypothetical protein
MLANLGLDPSANLRLDPESLGLTNPRELEVARVIAEETEAQRITVRASYPPTATQDSFFGPMTYDYAGTLPWQDLLTGGVSCVMACTDRLKIPPSVVVQFALAKCRPSNFMGLMWMAEYLKNLDDGLTNELATGIENKHLQATKNFFAGAIKGGKKSGETRRAKSEIPPRKELLKVRAQLVASHKATLPNVATKMAEMYGCTPTHIRRLLKDNGEET